MAILPFMDYKHVVKTSMIEVYNPNNPSEPELAEIYPDRAFELPSSSDIYKATAKGVILIALGICIIVATIFISLLCLGIPDSIMSIAAVTTTSHPLLYATIGAASLTLSLIGIYAIYKGTRCLRSIDNTRPILEDAQRTLAGQDFFHITLIKENKTLHNKERISERELKIIEKTVNTLFRAQLNKKLANITAKLTHCKQYVP